MTDFDAIWDEIDDAIGYDDIPEHAVTAQDVAEKRNVSIDVARRTLRSLERERGWKSGKRGMFKYYWPVE